MNWHKTTSQNGHGWTGQNSIYNMAFRPNKNGRAARAAFFSFALLIGGMGLINVPALLLGATYSIINLAGVMSLVGPLIVAAILLWVGGLFLSKVLPEFIGGDWALKADGGDLSYKTTALNDFGSPADGWSIPLNEITSVEAGRTWEWRKVRHYADLGRKGPLGGPYVPGLAAIQEVEYQTYVMTSDGRRLVIHTANAGREECSALALSVRAAVEAARTSAALIGAPSPTFQEPGFSL